MRLNHRALPQGTAHPTHRDIRSWGRRQKLRECFVILTAFLSATAVALSFDLAARYCDGGCGDEQYAWEERRSDLSPSTKEHDVADQARIVAVATVLAISSFIASTAVSRTLALPPHRETLRLLEIEGSGRDKRRPRIKGWLIRGAGTSMITLATACGLAMALAVRLIPRNESLSWPERLGALIGVAFGGTLVFALFAESGFHLWVKGKRYVAESAEHLLLRDARPPVLYLRSFRDDSVTSERVLHQGLLHNQLEDPSWYPRMFFANARMFTEEEQLAMALRKIGPFVAIGEPGEEVPRLGASRAYLSHEDWQHVVRELMLRARLVVLRAGNTPSFWWEFSQAATLLRPDQLLLLIPMDRDNYEVFCRHANRYLPVALPPYQSSFGMTGSIQAAIYFSPDWSPVITCDWKGGKLVKFAGPRALLIHLVELLRPVLQQLGVSAHPFGLRDVGRVVTYCYVLLWLLIVLGSISELLH
jgi:hypothetical protein